MEQTKSETEVEKGEENTRKTRRRANAMEHHQQYDRLRPDKLQSSEYFVLMLAMR